MTLANTGTDTDPLLDPKLNRRQRNRHEMIRRTRARQQGRATARANVAATRTAKDTLAGKLGVSKDLVTNRSTQAMSEAANPLIGLSKYWQDQMAERERMGLDERKHLNQQIDKLIGLAKTQIQAPAQTAAAQTPSPLIDPMSSAQGSASMQQPAAPVVQPNPQLAQHVAQANQLIHTAGEATGRGMPLIQLQQQQQQQQVARQQVEQEKLKTQMASNLIGQVREGRALPSGYTPTPSLAMEKVNIEEINANIAKVREETRLLPEAQQSAIALDTAKAERLVKAGKLDEARAVLEMANATQTLYMIPQLIAESNAKIEQIRSSPVGAKLPVLKELGAMAERLQGAAALFMEAGDDEKAEQMTAAYQQIETMLKGLLAGQQQGGPEEEEEEEEEQPGPGGNGKFSPENAVPKKPPTGGTADDQAAKDLGLNQPADSAATGAPSRSRPGSHDWFMTLLNPNNLSQSQLNDLNTKAFPQMLPTLSKAEREAYIKLSQDQQAALLRQYATTVRQFGTKDPSKPLGYSGGGTSFKRTWDKIKKYYGVG